jgi:hypothetical protein
VNALILLLALGCGGGSSTPEPAVSVKQPEEPAAPEAARALAADVLAALQVGDFGKLEAQVPDETRKIARDNFAELGDALAGADIDLAGAKVESVEADEGKMTHSVDAYVRTEAGKRLHLHFTYLGGHGKEVRLMSVARWFKEA